MKAILFLLKTILCLFILLSLTTCFDKGEEPLIVEESPIPIIDYSNKFTSGTSIRDLDQEMSKIYARAGKRADTTEAGEWNRYARWRSFWIDREMKYGTLKTGPEHYLTAMNTFNDYEVCDGSNGVGTAATWAQLGPSEGPPATAGVPLHALGAVFAAATDPNDLDVIYLGTGSGGMWKTTNGTAQTPIWTNITDDLRFPSLGISDIVIAPNNKQIIYAAASNPRHGYGLGVIKSTDAGASWMETDLGFDPISPFPIHKLLMHPSNDNIVFAHSDKEVFRTTNGGTNWSDLGFQAAVSNPNIDINNIEFDLSDPNTVFVSGEEIWKGNTSNQWIRLDNLSSFTPPTAPTGYTYNNAFAARISGVSGGCYALIEWRYNAISGSATSIKREVKKYTNSSNSWQTITLTNGFGDIFIVNPQNTNMMYIGNYTSGSSSSCCRVYKSINGGSSFFKITEYWPTNLYNGISNHADIRALKLLSPSIDGLSDIVLVGDDGGALLSTSAIDNGATHKVNWKDINGKGLAITEFFGIANNEFEPQLIHGGAQDNGLLSYDTDQWKINVIGDGYDGLVDWDNPDHAYGQINYPSIRKTTNRGQSWSWYSTSPHCKSPCSVGAPAWWEITKWPHFYDTNGDEYIGRLDLFKKISGSWTAISDFYSMGITNRTNIVASNVSPSNTDVIYVAFPNPTWSDPVNKRLFKSTNGGNSWTDITPSPCKWHSISDVISDPENPNRIWVSFIGIGKYQGQTVSRVYHSPDGGNTWEDWSVGLTEFPANTLAYQKGSNDLIYVGTDVGVFYREGGDKNTSWLCFNDDMPVAIVRDIEINYCAQKIRASTFGRGLWESDLAKPITAWGEEIIAGNVTYTGNMNIDKDITIENGATLTITNSAYLNIYKDRKISVKQGGKLIVNNGSTLSNNCGDFWAGIEVWGDENNSQHSAQGRVNLFDAIIENASNAVVNYRPFTTGTNGGMIIAKNTKFINNWRAIAAHPYNWDNPRRGLFINCEFVLDDNYISSDAPTNMITLWGINRYAFRSCRFEDNRTNPTDLVKAIYSADAGYEVYAFNNVPSTFKGFDVAIQANNTGNSYTISVKDSRFENNNKGIELESVHGARIIDNQFIIGKPTGGWALVDLGVGLYNSSLFTIEENEFIKATTADPWPVGLLIINSGDHPNEVYRNKFSNLFAGNWARGHNAFDALNPNFDCYFGLSYQCNENNGNEFDFVINHFPSAPINGISRTQGSINLATGNTFSTNANSYHLALFGVCGLDKYYYNSAGSSEEPLMTQGTNSGFKISANANPCPLKQIPQSPQTPLASLERIASQYDVIQRLQSQVEKFQGSDSKPALEAIRRWQREILRYEIDYKSLWQKYQRDTTLVTVQKITELSQLINYSLSRELSLNRVVQTLALSGEQEKQQLIRRYTAQKLTPAQTKDWKDFQAALAIAKKFTGRVHTKNALNKKDIEQLRRIVSSSNGIASLQAKQILDINGIRTPSSREQEFLNSLKELQAQKRSIQ